MREHRDIRKFEREIIRNLVRDKYKLLGGLDIGAGENKILGKTVDIEMKTHPDIVAPMHLIPLDDRSQNYIISCHSLEHTKTSPVVALKEFYRLLRKDGRIFIAVPDGNWVSSKDIGDGDMTHENLFTIMTLTKLLEYVGFKKVKCKLIEMNALFAEAQK